MEEKNKACVRCKHYQRYYLKGKKKFNATKFGRCRRRNESVSNCNSCEEFSIKIYRIKPYEYIESYLDWLLAEISTIRMIIEANEDEQKEL